MICHFYLRSFRAAAGVLMEKDAAELKMVQKLNVSLNYMLITTASFYFL